MKKVTRKFDFGHVFCERDELCRVEEQIDRVVEDAVEEYMKDVALRIKQHPKDVAAKVLITVEVELEE
jgi:hypothetical protein